jgi:hypothetical protein
MSAQVRPAVMEIKTVYLMPMSNGLDQYLATRLTKVGPFEVVTDPQLADAVFTDRLGMAFEDRWKELYPPPPPVVPPDAKPDPKATAKADTKAERKSEDDPETVTQPLHRISSFARGKGNVYLVSRKTNSVVWSDYNSPKDTRSQTMYKTAEKIVEQLQDDMSAKK